MPTGGRPKLWANALRLTVQVFVHGERNIIVFAQAKCQSADGLKELWCNIEANNVPVERTKWYGVLLLASDMRQSQQWQNRPTNDTVFCSRHQRQHSRLAVH